MSILNKISAALAFFIGLMSILAGSMVLLGIDAKEYNILTWLVLYNVVFGAISVFAAFLIWTDNNKSIHAILLIFFTHIVVLSYLLLFEDMVAMQSVKAMLFRIIIWFIILVLSVFIPKYIKSK